MEKLKYMDPESAIRDLRAKFQLPREHYKKSERDQDAEIQKRKEFHILINYLETHDPCIKYPIEITHCGGKEGFPDFLFVTDNVPRFIEISGITDQCSQVSFQNCKETEVLSVMGEVDLTPDVKKVVEKKNKKIQSYKNATGLQRSTLVLYYDKLASFYFGAPGDVLNISEIKSSFDETILLVPVYETDETYIKL
ncbi:MAG: hypothetical protein KGI37_09320 [Alphaproteobacteria bacterium]|nr:hypothetical protein [Alphaproteobacteria bacterium]